MQIALSILKIIGIVLLCLIALSLILLTTLLFVPIRYRLLAEKKEDIRCKGSLRWMFPFLSLSFGYENRSYAVLRIFGIPIYDKNRKKKPKAAKRSRQLKQSGQLKQSNQQKQSGQLSQSGRLEQPEQPRQQKQINEPEQPEQPKQEKRLVLFFKKIIELVRWIQGLFQNIQYTIKRFCDKIKGMIEKVAWYKMLLSSERTKRAFLQSKGELSRIWKNIRPRILQAKLRIGTNDPSITGEVLAIYGMLYPWIYPAVALQAEFEKEVFEGEVKLGGHITLFVLLRAAWILYFDRDIRWLREVVKEEKGLVN